MAQGNGHAGGESVSPQDVSRRNQHPYSIDPASLFAGVGPRFHVWRLEDGGRKVPYRHEGKHAKANDPGTWVSLSAALAILGHGGFTGLAIQLGKLPDGRWLVGIDLDLCRDADGGIADWALAIIERAKTYGEVSPSGTGVKLYGLADWLHSGAGIGGLDVKLPHEPLPDGWEMLGHSTPGMGLYPGRRYFAFTGQHLEDTPDELGDITELFAELIQQARSMQPAEPAPMMDASGIDLTPGLLTAELLGRVEAHPLAGKRWRNEDDQPDASKNDMRLALDLIDSGEFTVQETVTLLEHYQFGQIGPRKPGVNVARAIERCVMKALAKHGGKIPPRVEFGAWVEAMLDRAAGLEPSDDGKAATRAAEAGLAGADPETGEVPPEADDAAPGAPVAEDDAISRRVVLASLHAQAMIDAGVRGLPVPDGVLDPGGFLGDYMAWVISCMSRPQPFLALAGSIAMVSTLMGRRYRGPTNLRSNTMILGLAESGAGKNAAMDCNGEFLQIFDPRYLGGSQFKSGVGITDDLEEAAVRLYQIDEYGQFLRSILDPRARVAPYKREVMDVLTEMFTMSHRTRLGPVKGRSANKDGEKAKRRDIIQPCCNVFGVSVPKRLFEHMTGANIEDGSIARYLIMQTPENYPELVRAKGSPDQPPNDLLKQATSIVCGGMAGSADLFDAIFDSTTPPSLLPVQYADQAAEDDAQEVAKEQDARVRMNEGNVMAAAWARVAEMTYKLAMIHAVSLDPGKRAIGVESLEWGWLLAEHSIKTLTRNTANLAETDYERQFNRGLDFIRRFGPLTSEDLANRWRIKSTDRDEMLKNMQEAGLIEKAPTKTGSGKGRTGVTWIATKRR